MNPEIRLGKYAVSYVLGYTHRVMVGIEAESAEEAAAKAEEAFNAGTLWDDTQDRPLLFDDFEEDDDNTLSFSAQEIEVFPEPDASVLELRRRAAAYKACRCLLDDGTDEAQAFARQALGMKSEFPPLVEKRALVVVSGGNAYPYADPGVAVVVVDLDNLKGMAFDDIMPIHAGFAHLAELAGILEECPLSDGKDARKDEAYHPPVKEPPRQADALREFVRQVARLSCPGDVGYCCPQDGADDSEACLMALIAQARMILGNPI